MKKSISKLGTILIILVTVILAGVAIFTALRLYQLRRQPVAPNVPTSQPKAETAPQACTDDVLTCPPGADKEFARRVPPSCNFESCYTSRVCTDDAQQCPDGSWVSRVPPACSFAPCAGSCSIGFTFTQAPIQCNGTCTTNSDCQSSSTTSTTSTGTSTSLSSSSGTSSLICFQPTPTPCPDRACVTVMPPKVCRNPSCTTDADCVCATSPAKPTPTPTAKSTGTPIVSPTSTPTGSSTSTPTGSGSTTPTPTSRLATTAPVATPTAPSLPVSGTDWPTIFGAAIGLFVIVGSLLLAL